MQLGTPRQAYCSKKTLLMGDLQREDAGSDGSPEVLADGGVGGGAIGTPIDDNHVGVAQAFKVFG